MNKQITEAIADDNFVGNESEKEVKCICQCGNEHTCIEINSELVENILY